MAHKKNADVGVLIFPPVVLESQFLPLCLPKPINYESNTLVQTYFSTGWGTESKVDPKTGKGIFFIFDNELTKLPSIQG